MTRSHHPVCHKGHQVTYLQLQMLLSLLQVHNQLILLCGQHTYQTSIGALHKCTLYPNLWIALHIAITLPVTVLRPQPCPHKLERASGSGTLSREEEMPERDAAIQLNLARSRQEVKCRNNKQHPVTFQNKTRRVDTCREACCLPYCAVADSNHSRWGLPEGKTVSETQRSGLYPVETGLTH